uniref:Uncharacterized protein n=1 Tax=Arundo donax TaxID=35708 RepID=A0A0A9H4U9_ARUDO
MLPARPKHSITMLKVTVVGEKNRFLIYLNIDIILSYMPALP